MCSRIEPLKMVARVLRLYWSLIFNYSRFEELVALGPVEGLNNKTKGTTNNTLWGKLKNSDTNVNNPS